MDASIEAWNAAGIFVVWANGNEGSRCSTARYPASGDFEIFTVGATDSSDNLVSFRFILRTNYQFNVSIFFCFKASFSSRGPGMWSGADKIKPNIAAPGVNIISCSGSSDDGLASMSGTSMATPHTAGVIALLLTNHTQDYSFGELSSFLLNLPCKLCHLQAGTVVEFLRLSIQIML